MTPVRVEIRRLTALALPIAGAQLCTMMLGVVDTLMLGRFAIEALGAASLANVWVWGTLHLAMGILFGIDPIVAQAHGARDDARAGFALQRGLVLAVALCLPLGGLWLLTEEFLVAMGQQPELAAAAERYTRLQIPSLPFFLAFVTLRQFLQCREIVRPALWVLVGANGLNALANWALIFGHLGLPRLGLEGAAIATAVCRVACLAGLATLVARYDLLQGAWRPWSRRVLAPSGLLEILRLGIPVGLQISLEAWAFSGAALLAGLLGTEALAAHTIVLNLAALSFMVPLGVGLAAVTRVGNLLGARRPDEAQRAAWVALGLGAGVMAASAAVFLVLRHELPRLYTGDLAVVALAAGILPIAAAFQVFDGVQVVACGVLRGMGRTRPAAVFNAISYWALGIPLGWWLGVRGDLGLAGIWWGLCIGLALVSALLVAWIQRRGPARAALQLA
jgi:MATE family multidrug resistance protein